MSLDLAASAGYYISNSNKMLKANDQLENTKEKYRAFHDGVISASLNVPFAKYFTLTPIIAYSFPLSKEAGNRIKADNGQRFKEGGLSIRRDHTLGGLLDPSAFIWGNLQPEAVKPPHSSKTVRIPGYRSSTLNLLNPFL